MKYEILEVYTPNDRSVGRTSKRHTFESDSTNVHELAHAAWRACHSEPVSSETEANIGRSISGVIHDGQLEDYTSNFFEFVILGTTGEWSLSVQARCTPVATTTGADALK